jgi:hypothetical protein
MFCCQYDRSHGRLSLLTRQVAQSASHPPYSSFHTRTASTRHLHAESTRGVKKIVPAAALRTFNCREENVVARRHFGGRFLGGVLSNARKNLFRGGEGGYLLQITKNKRPNHTQQPTTACQTASKVKHVHILCLQFNSHLARDIGAQPDLQDLDTAPSAAFAARRPTC